MPSNAAASTVFRPALTKPNIVKFSIVSALLMTAMTVIPDLHAQQLAEPPAAPVPSQIVNAKRVFIANAYSEHDIRIAKYFGGPDGLYNQFYADVKSSGRFELVTAPADADLVLQVTLGIHPVLTNYAGLRLSIFDPKTNVLLWTTSEPVDPAFLTKTARRNIADSLQRLTVDLTSLAGK
jgi:hypothetical protein